jgi:hypothetical protein
LSFRRTISAPLVALSFFVFSVFAISGSSLSGAVAQENFYPHALACDYLAAPPGTSVTISGLGFSERLADMVVTFGGVPAQITFVRERSVRCVLPQMNYPAWNVPIVVKTFGIPSREKLTINVQERPIENPTFPPQ